jgi:hypothetical protein
MAFGALGRARAATDIAKASTPVGQVSDAASDDATAQDADQAAASSEFPNPADYATNDEKSESTSQQTAAKQAPTSDQKGQASQNEQMASAKPAVETSTDDALPGVVDTEINRALVVGLPLAGALALMGIYWLILRAGAV